MADSAEVHALDTRQEITIIPGGGYQAVMAVLQNLEQCPVSEIYSQGPDLVKLVRRNGRIEAEAYTKHVLAHVLTKIFRFRKVTNTKDGREIKVSIDCPRDLAQTILELGEWYGFPPLNAIINNATLRADGTVITETGYDDISGFYINSLGSRNAVNLKASRSNAEASLDLLETLFSEFPYVTPADYSAMMAMIIGAVVRPALRTSPAYGVSAPTPGTGKSIFCQSVLLLAMGQIPPVMPLSIDGKEAEKTFSAALQTRVPAIFGDDVKTVIRWPFLAPVLTADWAQLRVLGSSKLVSVPTNATIIFNGNNLSVAGDLTRRFLMINFDAGMERPEQRSFKINIKEYIELNRDELIAEILTIVASYIAAGAPSVEVLPSGYPEWDKFVRYPLIWLGRPDPLNANKDIRESDTETRSIAALCDVLLRISKDKNCHEFTAAGVIGYLNDIALSAQEKGDLHESLVMACGDKYDSTRLGNWFGRNVGRPVDGMRILKSRKDHHAKHFYWTIELAKADE